jgi:uncharacterized OB-fold protein
LCDFLSDKYVGQEWVKREDVLKDIEECPAADAQEVVHGKWEDFRKGYGWKCSYCGNIAFTDSHNYCPNCGAKMDGE